MSSYCKVVTSEVLLGNNSKALASYLFQEVASCKDLWTLQVFRKWRQQKHEEKAKQNADSEAERKRKGILTGREIFSQVGCVFVMDCRMEMQQLPGRVFSCLPLGLYAGMSRWAFFSIGYFDIQTVLRPAMCDTGRICG